MSYRHSGWKSNQTEHTESSTTSKNQMLKSFDYSIIPSTVFYLSLVVISGIFFTTCRVDATVIKQCQESCKMRLSSNGMEKVTAYSCKCDTDSSSFLPTAKDPWVLPRN